MKVTVLSLVQVVAACAATTIDPSMAAADTIYQSGDFARTNTEMTSCPGRVLAKRHPKLYYVMGNLSTGASVSGSWSTSTKSFIWMIVAKPTGSKSSHIDLHNKTANSDEIAEVWQVIEGCAKRQ